MASLNDPPPPRVLQQLRDFGVIMDLGGAKLDRHQFDLARRSPAFRALMRSSVDHPGVHDLRSLTAIWERSGSPAGKSPADWRADRNEPNGRDLVDWDEAAWFAHWLDPDNFDVAAERGYLQIGKRTTSINR